jgi:oxygen-dependent protoporphyrinogen oxidase
MAVRLVVVGGGISGLSLACALQRTGRFDLTVLEAQDRPGGKIWSEKTPEGYLVEWGVNGFLDNKPSTLEFCADLSLSPLRSSDAARKRFIFTGGALQRLPESPGAFLRSGIMSFPGKLRLAMEPFVGKRPPGEESLADFGRRRLGREAFEKLIDPMASGIYAGDPEQLSLRSCFPRINELEQAYGSLIKGMIGLMKERKKKVDAGPGGTLTSFREGMQSLSDAAAASLGDAVRVSSPVRAVERQGEGYRVHVEGGDVLEADAVAVACPAHQAAPMLKELDPALAAPAAEIPYPPLTVVCTAFRADRLSIPTDAFGFLVPGREGRRILGTLYDSSIFPNRAPEGFVLFRSMVGGARGARWADLPEEQLVDVVMGELGNIVGLPSGPDFVKMYRHEKAIPQYVLGHADRLGKMEAALEKHRKLYVTGNEYRGVSVNDCIENSLKLARRIIEEVQ